ncbi:hypothetical protein AVEN_43348-1 [Araneus ventricosus]|uniref:Uncharacterized protein n=1 Tax=Araneus ventricosus TaxID=182803 RepID=A0A4Y2FHP5_ARAVE|nr:hypothetical protein AVEN_43348-1 [Araneus ventricosus]
MLRMANLCVQEDTKLRPNKRDWKEGQYDLRHSSPEMMATSWASRCFFSRYWASSIMQKPRQEISRCENTLFLRLEKDVKVNGTLFIWETIARIYSRRLSEIFADPSGKRRAEANSVLGGEEEKVGQSQVD